MKAKSKKISKKPEKKDFFWRGLRISFWLFVISGGILAIELFLNSLELSLVSKLPSLVSVVFYYILILSFLIGGLLSLIFSILNLKKGKNKALSIISLWIFSLTL